MSDRWWFPSWGNRADVERDDGHGMAAFMGDEDDEEVPHRRIPETAYTAPTDPQRLAQEKEIRELKEKLAVLGSKLSASSAAPESFVQTSSPRESGFRTPRDHSSTTTGLIDLNTPPRKE